MSPGPLAPVSSLVQRIRRRLVLFALPCVVFGACVDGGDSSDDAGSATNAQTATIGTAGSGSSSGDPSGTTANASSASTTHASGADATGSAGSTGAADSGSSDGGGTIDVTLGGCDLDLGGTVVVSYNGSLGVASVYDNGANLTGSFQFDLDGTGVYALSSQHRVDTGTVINLVDIAQGTWTNLDSDALSGGVDTIGGTLTVDTWDPASGISDLQLDDVSLLNTSTANVCTINGTIVTTELYP